MTPHSLQPILSEHPFFQGLPALDIEVLTGCASNVVYKEGEVICRAGDDANQFFLIRHGRIALELPVPGRGQVVLQTVGTGEVVGWSWLIPPYQWRFDVRAIELVRAIVLDGKCLRGKCEENPRLGYELLKRVAQVFAERLLATRLQLLDVYGNHR